MTTKTQKRSKRFYIRKEEVVYWCGLCQEYIFDFTEWPYEALKNKELKGKEIYERLLIAHIRHCHTDYHQRLQEIRLKYEICEPDYFYDEETGETYDYYYLTEEGILEYETLKSQINKEIREKLLKKAKSRY